MDDRTDIKMAIRSIFREELTVPWSNVIPGKEVLC